VDLLSHLRRQIAYDDWANREALRAIRAAQRKAAPARRALAHVIGAEELWLARLTASAATVAVWPSFSADECAAHLDALKDAWRRFFESLDAAKLEAKVEYVNSKGEPWSSTVLDILQHVVIHSSHHRGQISASLRDGGDAPPYVDYIHCMRQGLVR
jgi:uncharacterized damage-inducible protein DinB